MKAYIYISGVRYPMVITSIDTIHKTATVYSSTINKTFYNIPYKDGRDIIYFYNVRIPAHTPSYFDTLGGGRLAGRSIYRRRGNSEYLLPPL